MCKIEIGRVGYYPRGYFPYRCDRNVHSPLRNCFKLDGKTQESREESCKLFSEHFSEKINQRTSEIYKSVTLLLWKARSGKYLGIYLQCHCYPLFKPCHCETIKKHLEEELKCQ